jgi:hypothetical protein
MKQQRANKVVSMTKRSQYWVEPLFPLLKSKSGNSSAMTTVGPNVLLADVRQMILAARQTFARGANAALVALYWRLGQRIQIDILQNKRADYGQQIVVTLSRQLTVEFGTGFHEKNLRRMVQFAEEFSEERVVATLSQQLGWSHFISLLPLKKHLQRDFYAEMCRIEKWSVRTLRRKITGMLYERTALSKNQPFWPRWN